MKQSDWRYCVEGLLFVTLGGMILIGVVLGLVIPTGPAVAESSKYFLGLHRHQWGDFHAYLSIVFVALLVVHLVFNWKWVTSMTSQIFKKKAVPILIITGFAPFLVVLVFWLLTPKDAAKYKGYGVNAPGRGRTGDAAIRAHTPASAGQSAVRRDDSAEIPPSLSSGDAAGESEAEDHKAVGPLVITGRQTLYDIERATGISAGAIADRLGLPSSVSQHETLGRLKRFYGIEIQTVRDVVKRMRQELNRIGPREG